MALQLLQLHVGVANSTNDQLSVRLNHVCAVLQRLPDAAKAGYSKELEHQGV